MRHACIAPDVVVIDPDPADLNQTLGVISMVAPDSTVWPCRYGLEGIDAVRRLERRIPAVTLLSPALHDIAPLAVVVQLQRIRPTMPIVPCVRSPQESDSIRHALQDERSIWKPVDPSAIATVLQTLPGRTDGGGAEAADSWMALRQMSDVIERHARTAFPPTPAVAVLSHMSLPHVELGLIHLLHNAGFQCIAAPRPSMLRMFLSAIPAARRWTAVVMDEYSIVDLDLVAQYRIPVIMVRLTPHPTHPVVHPRAAELVVATYAWMDQAFPQRIVDALAALVSGDRPTLASSPPSAMLSLNRRPAALDVPPAVVADLTRRGFSPRMIDIIWLLSRNYTDSAIARELAISEHTVRSHLLRIGKHLQMGRAEVRQWAGDLVRAAAAAPADSC